MSQKPTTTGGGGAGSWLSQTPVAPRSQRRDSPARVRRSPRTRRRLQPRQQQRSGPKPRFTAPSAHIVDLVYAGDVEGVAREIAKNPDVVNLERAGRTPLTEAVIFDRPEIVQLLLSVPRLNVNWRNTFGETALHYAARWNRDAMIRMLLSHPQVDINAPDTKGMTALDTAIRFGNEEAEMELQRAMGFAHRRRPQRKSAMPVHGLVE